MEIKIDCPIQVGDLVWVKPEMSYNFIQSKVTNVYVDIANGHVVRITYNVEDLDYELTDDGDGIFFNKEDIFKFHANSIRSYIPDDFGKYVFCDKSTTVY